MRNGYYDKNLPEGKTILELLEERVPGLYDVLHRKFTVEFDGEVYVRDHKLVFRKEDSSVRFAWVRYFSDTDAVVFLARKEYKSGIKENKTYFECVEENREIIIKSLEIIIDSYKEAEQNGTLKKRRRRNLPVQVASPVCEEAERNKIEDTRNFLRLLAVNIDPVTMEEATIETLTRNEVKERLLYCVDLLSNITFKPQILQEQIDKMLLKIDGEESPVKFSDIKPSDKPVLVTTFITRINKAVSGGKKLTSQKIYDYLGRLGYIEEREVQIVKTAKERVLTEKSDEIGLETKAKTDEKTGEVTEQIILTTKTQQFIIDNLEEIYDKEVQKEETMPIDVGDALPCEDFEKGIKQKKPEDDKQPSETKQMRIGERWTKEEEEQLVEEFTALKYTISQIAEIHARKYGGIKSRLQKLGLIED